MTGTNTLQQGLLGVTATTRRPAAKPAGPRRLRVADSATTQLNERPPHQEPERRPPEPESPETEDFLVPVAPSTLLEASLISATLTPDGGASFAALPGRSLDWIPPGSALTLRDRKA